MKEPTILFIDTVLPELTVGIMCDGSPSFRHSPHQRSHDKHINPLVSELLGSTGKSFGSIDYYAVVAGPGSWTGCRVGIAAVKGFSAAVPKPIIVLNTLDVISYGTNMPAALHSHSNNYFIKEGSKYSSRQMENTDGFITLDVIGKEEYLKKIVECIKNAVKTGQTVDARNLAPFYITDFIVKA